MFIIYHISNIFLALESGAKNDHFITKFILILFMLLEFMLILIYYKCHLFIYLPIQLFIHAFDNI